MIFLDAHVHLYQQFDLAGFLAAAKTNFQALAAQAGGEESTFVLCFSEARNDKAYQQLRQQADTGEVAAAPGWQIASTSEEESLVLSHQGWASGQIVVLAGRQLFTAERLEVLALATTTEIAEGMATAQTIEQVREAGGIAVLPWGVGKWLGARGKVVADLVVSLSPEGFFLGDNGGRPALWSAPAVFTAAQQKGIGLLSGSDPLPLAGEEQRVASFGSMLPGHCSSSAPAAELKQSLRAKGTSLQPFGKNAGLANFLKTQVSLRLAK